MRRRLLILLAVSGIVIVGWLGSVQAKPIAPGVNVGVLISTSGPLYFAGAYQRAGCELAEQQANISCFYADAGDSEIEAKAALRNLRGNSVDVLVAPIETDSVKTIAKLNLADPVPIVAPSSIAEGIAATAKGKNWLFRLASTSTQDASALADYIAQEKPDSVAILVGPENYSKQGAKMLQFGLVIRGITGVHQYSLQEIKAAKATNPEAVVLVSMESSVQFLTALGDWFGKVPAKFLVQGNLANYSMYSWANQLQGARALIPNDQIEPGFREEVARYLNRPPSTFGGSQAMLGLAWRTYQAARLAGGLQNDQRVSLERMKQVFSPTGYYLNQKYTVYGYRAGGSFAPVGSYQPDTP